MYPLAASSLLVLTEIGHVRMYEGSTTKIGVDESVHASLVYRYDEIVSGTCLVDLGESTHVVVHTTQCDLRVCGCLSLTPAGQVRRIRSCSPLKQSSVHCRDRLLSFHGQQTDTVPVRFRIAMLTAGHTEVCCSGPADSRGQA